MRHKISVMLVWLLLLALSPLASDMSASEIDYKAEFIVNLVDDVTWPDNAARESDGSIVIAVVGESPLTAPLSQMAADRGGLKVKTVTINDDLTDCRILFIPTEDKTILAQILKKVKTAPVLTVSDAYYFARYGVMVNFYTEETDGQQKVKFEVNTMTMGFVGIKMKSNLLELATVI